MLLMLSLFSVASITSGASGGRADARAICRWWWRHPRSNSLMAPFWRVFYWRGWRHPPSLPPSLPPSFLLLLPGCNLRVEIGAIFCWPSTKQILQFPLVFLIPFRDILLHFFFSTIIILSSSSSSLMGTIFFSSKNDYCYCYHLNQR